jgi:membrane associated rhomboid family serine protease
LYGCSFFGPRPQVPTFGFSSSVSAYFGAYAALWALATAEALDVGKNWRIIYVELQLFLLLLTPASRYPTHIAALLAPLAQYMLFASTMLAVLLAVRSPRTLHKFLEKVPPQVKQPRRTGMVLLGLLLFPYMLYAPLILDSLYPASAVTPGTGGIVNLEAHFVGMVAGYLLTCLYTTLVRNNSLYS